MTSGESDVLTRSLQRRTLALLSARRRTGLGQTVARKPHRPRPSDHISHTTHIAHLIAHRGTTTGTFRGKVRAVLVHGCNTAAAQAPARPEVAALYIRDARPSRWPLELRLSYRLLAHAPPAGGVRASRSPPARSLWHAIRPHSSILRSHRLRPPHTGCVTHPHAARPNTHPTC